MDKYDSFSEAFLITRTKPGEQNHGAEPYMVVQTMHEAEREVEYLKGLEGSISYPFYRYEISPVSYKHHN